MKKLSKFLFFALTMLLFSAKVAIGASLAMVPIISHNLSIEDIEKLAETNFSSFNGQEYNQYLSYDGTDHLAFLDASRVFTIIVTGTTSNYSGVLYLIPGLDYAMGQSGVNGVIYDGTGNTKNAAGTALTNMTFTGSPKNLSQLYGYLNDCPTILNMVKIYSSNLINTTSPMIYKEQSPFQDLESKIIPLTASQTEATYRSTIATVDLLRYNVQAGNQSQLAMQFSFMYATDTLSIEMYFSKSENSNVKLKQQLFAAKGMSTGVSASSVPITMANLMPVNPTSAPLTLNPSVAQSLSTTARMSPVAFGK